MIALSSPSQSSALTPCIKNVMLVSYLEDVSLLFSLISYQQLQYIISTLLSHFSSINSLTLANSCLTKNTDTQDVPKVKSWTTGSCWKCKQKGFGVFTFNAKCYNFKNCMHVWMILEFVINYTFLRGTPPRFALHMYYKLCTLQLYYKFNITVIIQFLICVSF